MQRKIRKGEGFWKVFSAKLFYRFFKKITMTSIPEDVGDFQLIDRKIVNDLKNIQEKNRYLRGLVSWIGYRQSYILYERDQRHAGKTKYSLRKMILLSKDAIFSFSVAPLKIITIFGIWIFIISMGFISYFLYLKLFKNDSSLVEGWTSLFVVILFLGSIQLISMGILGEYIARIYDKTKKRLLYLINKTKNIKKYSV